MWTARYGGSVDGVLALDVPALKAVLAATGPVQVGDLTVGSENVEQQLFHDQYVGIAYDRTLDVVQANRREQLGAIARAAVDLVQRGDVDFTDLASGLADAAGGRHVLLWSARPDEQAAWTQANLAGVPPADALLVSVLNRAGNKLDQYLETAAHLTSAPAAGGAVDVTLAVDLRNTTPANEPPYVSGPRPDTEVPEGGYSGLLSVTLPGAAQVITFGPDASLAVAGADGATRVAATQVDLARGEARHLELRFRLPKGFASILVEPSARRPAVRWTAGAATWEDDAARRVRLGE
jgi:hypothetical protein